MPSLSSTVATAAAEETIDPTVLLLCLILCLCSPRCRPERGDADANATREQNRAVEKCILNFAKMNG